MHERSCPRASDPIWLRDVSVELVERAGAHARTEVPAGGGAVYDRGLISGLVIRLLGSPEIERDGVVAVPPRGHKPWAVLAYLVLAERPVARPRLAGLMFGEAVRSP